MRFDQVSPPLSEYPQRRISVQDAGYSARVPSVEICWQCALGFSATKLKRQWVHHDPQTGRIIVCTAHDLKPGS